MHGIWAFKASASGERTDLVLGGRLDITPKVQVAAEALVLTEWKCVAAARLLRAKIGEARVQLRRYSESILAGFELASDRYVVLVSENLFVDGLDDLDEDGVTYHMVNVAVTPAVPSRVARKRSGK